MKLWKDKMHLPLKAFTKKLINCPIPLLCMNVIALNFLWNYVIIKKTHYFQPKCKSSDLSHAIRLGPTRPTKPVRGSADSSLLKRIWCQSGSFRQSDRIKSFIDILNTIYCFLNLWIRERRRKYESKNVNSKSICIPLRLDLWTKYVKMVHIWWNNFVRPEYKS